MAKQFEVIRVLASTAPGFSKRDAYVAICGLVDKASMSDLKDLLLSSKIVSLAMLHTSPKWRTVGLSSWSCFLRATVFLCSIADV
jgi:hypothetical protein